jgi:nitrite reductase/ring-hydroxylating ferredoxin subunit
MTDVVEAAAEPRPAKVQKVVVARVGEIEPGGKLIVDVEGRSIGIFNVKGRYYGMLNRCPHLGGPLAVGVLVPDVTSTGQGDVRLDDSRMWLTCPWHNWEFDVTNGQSYWNPSRMKARPFAVEVEDGTAVIRDEECGVTGRAKGPYQAETIEVSVEEEYVVVSLRPLRPGQKTRPAGPADRPVPDTRTASDARTASDRGIS